MRRLLRKNTLIDVDGILTMSIIVVGIAVASGLMGHARSWSGRRRRPRSVCIVQRTNRIAAIDNVIIVVIVVISGIAVRMGQVPVVYFIVH